MGGDSAVPPVEKGQTASGRPGSSPPGPTRVLIIDNYDSFVYNLVQQLGELGAEPLVHRNDAIEVAEAIALQADAAVISPGPGRPEDAGISVELIKELSGRMPVLGVCLGHQCVGQAFGGEIVQACEIMHGKTSLVRHGGQGVLSGLPDPFEATRYHSLVVRRASLPSVLEVTAKAGDGTIMALRHRQLRVEGVQFHPESILTRVGRRIIETFLASAVGPRY